MLYRMYLSFCERTEYLTKYNGRKEVQTAYPLGSLTFGTMETDWSGYLDKALKLREKCIQLRKLPPRTTRQSLDDPENCTYILVAGLLHELVETTQKYSPALAALLEDHDLAPWRYYRAQTIPIEKRIWTAVRNAERPMDEDRAAQLHATEMMIVAEMMEDYCLRYPELSPAFTNHMDTVDKKMVTVAEQLLAKLIENLQGMERLKKDLDIMLPLTLYTQDGRPAVHPGQRLLQLQQSAAAEYCRCAAKIEQLHTKMIGYNVPENNKIKKGGLSAALAYAGDDLPAMVFLEFQEMCSQELPVAVCAYCGKLFVPFSGNAKYCQRIADPATGQTCQEIGPKLKYNSKVEENPARILYNKERNKRHMRCVRASENKKMQQDYEVWCDMAQKLLIRYELGEVSFEEYQNFFTEET